MKQRRRAYYSAAQRSEIWDRWQAGEPMSSIGRRFDRESSSVFSVISPTGGIRPPDRYRAKQALSLSEREEISRWLSMRCSLRSIARRPETIRISRETASYEQNYCSPIGCGASYKIHQLGLRITAFPNWRRDDAAPRAVRWIRQQVSAPIPWCFGRPRGPHRRDRCWTTFLRGAAHGV